METRDPAGWFCALLDHAEDVYFRYALEPARRFAYISPSVTTLTGSTPDQFYRDPDHCLSLLHQADRPVLRRMLRSRRSLVSALRLLRHGTAIPMTVRTVVVKRHGRVVALEGVASLAMSSRTAGPTSTPPAAAEPIQPRLAALMVEVHELLHRAMPSVAESRRVADGHLVHLGTLTFDLDALTITDNGRPVPLPSRELMVLRYLVQRPGRIVTRAQLLADVWKYSYTGDDRTVDVHISRLRRRLPSLRGRLVAIRHIGYRLDLDEHVERRATANG